MPLELWCTVIRYIISIRHCFDAHGCVRFSSPFVVTLNLLYVHKKVILVESSSSFPMKFSWEISPPFLSQNTLIGWT